MSAAGLHLVSVGFCTYVFEEGSPGKYIVRMQFLEGWPSDPSCQRYIKFIEDTGAQEVGRFGQWVYFRKKRDDSGFEIFSDIDSRAKTLTGLLTIFGILGLSQITILLSKLTTFFKPPIVYAQVPI